MIGASIAHYRIVQKIGEGGMGEVYLAEDLSLDRRVAIKVLSSRNPDEAQIGRFEREAKAAAALDHPNILAIHGFGRVGSMPYVVMELLDGTTLRHRLEEGPIPLRTSLTYGAQVARGLAAAHERGICHRDVKPENIFITRDGRVKILDFGLANVRESAFGAASDLATRDRLTTPGLLIGTTGYMSPEQVRGESVDHRADIFALGTLLFEMLAHRRPFAEPTIVETMHAILNLEPPLRWLDEAAVPGSIVQVVSRCLEKHPNDRYRSAVDIAEALETVLASVSSRSGATLREARLTRAARSIGVLPFKNMSADPDTEYFSDGITEDIINALAQLKNLHVAARTSCFAFKGKDADVSEIGAKLRVGAILEGSVRRAGTRLRVTAQLVNVADGFHLWSDRYDRELDDVFAIQDDIATNIARKLHVALADAAADGPLVRPATDNLDAYDLYLKGRYLIEQRGDGIARGLEFFNRAIEVDPNYGLAYAAIAETLSLLAVYTIVDPAGVLPRAKAAAERAVQLDEDLAESHNAMALVSLIADWEWERAAREFDRAIAINPNHVPALYWKGVLYWMFVKGRVHEAVDSTLRALDLDPISPIAAYAHGLTLIGARRYVEAGARAEEVLARDPTQPLMYRVLGVARLGEGRYDEAIATLEKGAAMSSRSAAFVHDIGAAHIAAGRPEQAQLLQDELTSRARSTFVSPLALAVIPHALGRVDEAVAYVERAFEQRDPLFIAITTWPTLAAINGEPRVQALLHRIGIDWVKPS